MVLAAMARRLGIPGATAAIVSGDRRATAATGVLNMATGASATPESLFLIGSISKVWTATLVMQLVDEGSVALDDPVRRYVPDLALASDQASGALTIRHLLTHTSGLEDDFTISSGDRGDGCIRRYVERLSSLGQLHPVGAMYSYCNSGFVLAGEVIERVEGATFDDVLRARVIDRLGLTDTVLLPEEALLRAVAVGHVPVDGSLGVAPVWSLPRAFGPAGATIAASAPDLLRFAEAHLSAGEVGGRRAPERVVGARDAAGPGPPARYAGHVGGRERSRMDGLPAGRRPPAVPRRGERGSALRGARGPRAGAGDRVAHQLRARGRPPRTALPALRPRPPHHDTGAAPERGPAGGAPVRRPLRAARHRGGDHLLGRRPPVPGDAHRSGVRAGTGTTRPAWSSARPWH